MNSKHEADAARVSEMLFVDTSVDDLATILCHLRPGVEAVVLDRATPPARQMPWPCTVFAVSMPSM